MSKSRIPLFERLQIESQSNCNRSCWFCPRTYDRTGTYLDADGKAILQEMPTQKVIELLDQAQAMEFRELVAFYHYSEPLLDKRNVMLAREAQRRGMKPYLHTNGDVLKHDDGLCREVMSVYTLIVVGLYDYQTNEELAAAKDYWLDKLAGANIEFSPIGLAGARTVKSIGVPRALVPSDSRMGAPDLKYVNAPCHRPLIRMLIQHDGKVCLCCEDTFGAFELGNVYDRSLDELWFSEKHVEIIETLIAGQRENYELCRNCPMPPTAPANKGTKIDIAPRRYRGTANQ
jgi:radical SAM protein with 4Fe4S-binding SPASM domain